ncbi:MAG: zinc ribbon-containing protein [Gammaproteobacteria bacterium]|nr:MAG: zinc ribbon-containing protein [Gammaproteobacteria bacterium]
MIQLQKKPANHLISAYNQMMQEMRDAFERADQSSMSLQKALELAKHQAVHLGEITAEEAHEIGEYIKRDINDAAEYMMESSAEFYDWLMLDIEVIERKVIDMFLSVADHTRVELEQFRQAKPESKQIPVYKSGEITGPGTLICDSCGKTKPFLSSDEIRDCERCGHDHFIRRQQNDS